MCPEATAVAAQLPGLTALLTMGATFNTLR